MICPICSNPHSQELFQAGSWERFAWDKKFAIRRCEGCSAVFTAPSMTDAELEEFYSRGLYQSTQNRFNKIVAAVSHVFQRARLQRIARLKTGHRLLDFGCGKGRFLAYAARRGWNVYGLEPAENGREIARHRLGDRVVAGFNELPPDGPFDVITLWHVLEHISEPIVLLEEIHPHLGRDGVICIAVPNFDSLQARMGGRSWGHLDVPRHRIHYMPQTIRHALERSGYTTLRVTHFSLEFNPIGVLQTLLNLSGCEPGLIYKIIKRDFSYGKARSKIQFIYSLLMIFLGIPLLLIPSLMFAWIESILGKGGTMLVYARPSAQDAPNMETR